MIAAPAGQTGVSGVRLENPPPLTDAEAPTLAVVSAPDVDEGGTSQITATPTGGTYDGISYEYEIVSGPAVSKRRRTHHGPGGHVQPDAHLPRTGTATGNGTDAADGSSDTGAWVQTGTLTVRNVAVITTDTDSVWRLAATQPATPTGGTGTQTHTPTGWTRGEPDATQTESVWRSQRTRTFSDGAFTSATMWRTPTETEAPPALLFITPELDESTVPPPTTSPLAVTILDPADETALFEFNSAADFSAVFPDAVFANNLGRWRFDTGGSTASPNTGPAANNVSPFVHTETSQSVQATVESNGIADFGIVPDQAGRTLHLRLAIQGTFGDGTEGLQIQHRAVSTDAWSEAGFVHGWVYQDYELGDTITDENGMDRVCVQDGGWVDVAIAIPDTATQVRLQPRYILAGLNFSHDIALRSVQWAVTLPDAGVITPELDESTVPPPVAEPVRLQTQSPGTITLTLPPVTVPSPASTTLAANVVTLMPLVAELAESTAPPPTTETLAVTISDPGAATLELTESTVPSPVAQPLAVRLSISTISNEVELVYDPASGIYTTPDGGQTRNLGNAFITWQPGEFLHTLIEILLTGATYRYWTGEGDMIFEGVMYRGGRITDVFSPIGSTVDGGLVSGITLAITGATERADFLRLSGTATARLRVIGTTDGGFTYTPVGRLVEGPLNSGILQGGRFNFELSPRSPVSDRAVIIRWSHEDRVARYGAGDRGMARMSALAGEGLPGRWPRPRTGIEAEPEPETP